MGAREAEGRCVTFALWRTLFAGCLMADSILMLFHRNVDTLIPHFSFLMPLAESIRNPFLLTLGLRVMSFVFSTCLVLGLDDSSSMYLNFSLVTGFMYSLSVYDSFQHHYLFVVVMFLVAHDERGGRHVRMHEMILTFTSMVYAWSSVTKLTSSVFMSGEFFLQTMFTHKTVDRVLGWAMWTLFPSHLEEGIVAVQMFARACSHLVTGTEVFLAFSLTLRPTWWLNTLLMVLLHSAILVFEYIDDQMHTQLFAVYMFAIACLTVPPVGPHIRWIKRLVPSRLLHLPAPSDTPLSSRGWVRYLGTGWIPSNIWSRSEARAASGRVLSTPSRGFWSLVLVLFFAVQLHLPLRCYAPVPWQSPDVVDVRGCWRMFSDVSVRACTMEWSYRNTRTRTRGDFTFEHQILNTLNSPMFARRFCLRRKNAVDSGVGVASIIMDVSCYLQITAQTIHLHNKTTILC